MILESIVTTKNADGSTNISPMGPTVAEDLSRFELRPFNTSTTFQNLKRNRCGVMHVSDDVLLIAMGAVGKITSAQLPEGVELDSASVVDCEVISTACRWYEFEVEFIDETGPRMALNCKTVHVQRNRDFFGFNRAKHAVLEAAILATRINFLPAEEISDQFQRLKSMVAKTGGPRELEAFKLLSEFIEQKT